MQALGWQVEGVDFDPKGVRNAQAKGLTVHLGDLDRQGYPDDSFDAVAMSHVIEHVPDPSALLRECRRILKPGGRLVVLTPNVASWGHRLYGSDWRGLEPPRRMRGSRPSIAAPARERAGYFWPAARSAVPARWTARAFIRCRCGSGRRGWSCLSGFFSWRIAISGRKLF